MKTNSEATAHLELSRQSVLAEVTKLVGEHMDISPKEIGETNDLVNDIGCDSLDITEIAMLVEEHYDIDVPDDLYQDARMTGAIADRVLAVLVDGASG